MRRLQKELPREPPLFPRASAASSGEIEKENFRPIHRAQLYKALFADSSAIARLQGCRRKKNYGGYRANRVSWCLDHRRVVTQSFFLYRMRVLITLFAARKCFAVMTAEAIMKVRLGFNLIDEYNDVVFDITNDQCTTRIRTMKWKGKNRVHCN